MRGHVKKKKGNWYAVLDIVHENGRSQKWFSPRKELKLNRKAEKKDAEKVLLKKLREIDEGIDITSEMTFEQLFKVFCENKIYYRSPGTIENYELFFKKNCDTIKKMKIRDIKRIHVEKVIKDMQYLSYETVKNRTRKLRTILQYAVVNDLITKNPAQHAEIPKQVTPEQKVKVWDKEQVNLFLDKYKNKRDTMIYYMMLTTGMRPGEALALKWDDVDIKKQTINIDKSLGRKSKIGPPKNESSYRVIDISKKVAMKFQEYKKWELQRRLIEGQKSDFCFVTRNGKLYHRTSLSGIFNKKVKKIDIPQINLHGLRHTHASLLLQEGADVKDIAERLGHSSVKVTYDTYIHLLPDRKKETASLLDFIL